MLALIYRAERCIIHPPLCGGRSRSGGGGGVEVTRKRGEEGKKKSTLAKLGEGRDLKRGTDEEGRGPATI